NGPSSTRYPLAPARSAHSAIFSSWLMVSTTSLERLFASRNFWITSRPWSLGMCRSMMAKSGASVGTLSNDVQLRLFLAECDQTFAHNRMIVSQYHRDGLHRSTLEVRVPSGTSFPCRTVFKARVRR